MSIITDIRKTVRNRMTGAVVEAQAGGTREAVLSEPEAPILPAEEKPPSGAARTNGRGKPRTRNSQDAGNPEVPERMVAVNTPIPDKLSKSEIVLRLLGGADGATLAGMMEATGWQAHSVRGFLSGTVRKKLGLNLISETTSDGKRCYRIKNAERGPEPAPDETGTHTSLQSHPADGATIGEQGA